MKKFLVTGAAGFIGSHCVDRLLEQGYEVIGVDNLRSGHMENLISARSSSSFEFIEQDVGDELAMKMLFGKHRFAGVLHLAALVSVPESFKEPALNYRINLAASDLLARQCVAYDCKRFVFASSAAVYGNSAIQPNVESAKPHPLSPYAAAKLASEVMLLGYVESYNLEAVCFRYFNIYGPRQDPSSPYSGVLSIFTQRFQAGLPAIVFGDGEQTRDFVAVEDVVRANVHALTASSIVSGRYNVCTGRSISLNQVLAIYRKVYPDAPPIQYTDARIGDIRHSFGDSSRLRHIFGINAQIPFEEGIKTLLMSSQNLLDDYKL